MKKTERNSVPVRVYLLRENLKALGDTCGKSGVTLSALINAAVKYGMADSKTLIEDAKDAKKHG